MNSPLVYLSVLACLVSIGNATPFRDPKGTFYVNNPIHSTCVGDDGRMGYCLLQGCFVNDLTYKGRCAFGLGSCCLAEQSCLRSTNVNNTYYVNPEFPQTTTSLGSCEMIIKRRTKDICQIRLDFLDFELEQPDKDGNCYNDVFTVNGSTNAIPNLCGSNKGQHLYIDVDPLKNDDPVVLSIQIKELTLLPRKWNIKVAQISCSSQEKAPSGCLQYYTGPVGVVDSFNYKNKTSGTKGTRQLSNSSYSVCVRQEAGFCGISWSSNKIAGPLSFAVTGDVTSVPKSELGTPAQSNRTCSDTDDFVLIPNGKDENGKLAERLCGLGFAAEVTTTVTPFLLHTNTGPNENTDVLNTGFSLHYTQKPLPC